jgi:serine protease Do
MNRRTLIAAVVLVGVGMVLGILLMSHLGAGAAPRALQAQQRSQLGAPNPPIAQPSELVRQLNRAFVDVANAVLPSVVGIRVYQRGSESPSRFFEFFGPFRRFFEDEEGGSPEAPPPPREVQGAGVIITEDGYIVTNNHVVERVKEEDLRVVLHDGKELRAKIIGRDPLTDLALLKVDAKGLKPAYFGNVEDIQVGEWVIAVGNPWRIGPAEGFLRGGVLHPDRCSHQPREQWRRTVYAQRRAHRDQYCNRYHDGLLPGLRLCYPD